MGCTIQSAPHEGTQPTHRWQLLEVMGLCVMMQMVPRYQNLLHGAELVESQLKESFNEYLNAEITLRTVTDVSMAIAWLKGSFFYIRVRLRL